MKLSDEYGANYQVCEDEYDKIEWIEKRIKEVYIAYDRKLPSIAIFLNDKDKISSELSLNKMESYDSWNEAVNNQDEIKKITSSEEDKPANRLHKYCVGFSAAINSDNKLFASFVS